MKKFIISFSWQGRSSGGFGNIEATPANGEKFTTDELQTNYRQLKILAETNRKAK